ncbi:glycosyltransferase family 4 protein [Cupriavidus gilardii]|uniref:glycosyltransferase family 4 protein n=1 Tax=Cupriavidus gilardii TaxID=82541 RepID=UPI001571887E|nr:glycosyltransferase family 4 protein [Cupriavidus gilardii]NSX02674.1 glycosyltransferase family 4 protein [Cupriavidus gilardii]
MPERLRILTWHVHGNYLYYLSQIPHDLYLVTKPGSPPGYAGAVGALPWGDNVHEVAYEDVPNREFDCVLYQHQRHWDSDRETLLTEVQRRLPTIFLEHDPPQQHPTATVHPVQDPNVMLVHVTPFNALMWDSGVTPHCVIEHGVLVDPSVRYSGEAPRGISVVNNLTKRGRRLGADIFAQAREQVPLDLVGMAAEEAGGLGEVPNPELAAFIARYRFFFNPIRYTSLGLAVVEAMMIGMPVVGMATTEMSTAIRNEYNGYVDTRLERLVEVMRRLIDDPGLAREWGEQARASARQRFGIGRFVEDWCGVLRQVAQ